MRILQWNCCNGLGTKPQIEYFKSFECDIAVLPELKESNIEGLYLAGVICGGTETHKWFIENSRIHATLIADDIYRKMNV